jgi:serine/threonine protein kinase
LALFINVRTGKGQALYLLNWCTFDYAGDAMCEAQTKFPSAKPVGLFGVVPLELSLSKDKGNSARFSSSLRSVSQILPAEHCDSSKIILERYIIDELLGEGGFGAVYRVHDRRMKNNVFALKEVVDPNKRQYERFTFEGELLQRLDHPHLPRVYRVFADEKAHHLYMLMDYIDGPNLEHLRVRQPERRFSFSQTLKIMAPIIEAVIYLHTQTPPIIHRDIKPANIIVPNASDGAVLVDLGIAKAYDLNATTTAIRYCSPGYGAPEQYICNTNPRTDIYGLGATFYALLTGEVPVDSLYRLASLSTKGTDPLVTINKLIPDLPAPVAELIQHALAIDSNERFTSVKAFWEALQEYVSRKVTDSLSPEGLVEAGLASTSRLHLSTEKGTIKRSLTHLPTAPLQRNLLQPGQTTGTRHKHGQVFSMKLALLMILALSAGAIFATGQWLSMRHKQAAIEL